MSTLVSADSARSYSRLEFTNVVDLQISLAYTKRQIPQKIAVVGRR
jgi:hypothetical protein